MRNCYWCCVLRDMARQMWRDFCGTDGPKKMVIQILQGAGLYVVTFFTLQAVLSFGPIFAAFWEANKEYIFLFGCIAPVLVFGFLGVVYGLYTYIRKLYRNAKAGKAGCE